MFDPLTIDQRQRLAVLYVLGLNRERSSVTILSCPDSVEISFGSNSVPARQPLVFREQAS